jgi:acyl-coenzyme A synthetase/AMP-(fatty) acid ligase
LTQIRVMPELPKTETGKITRNTLKQIFATANDR